MRQAKLRKKRENPFLKKLEQNPQILFDLSPLLKSNLEHCERQFGEMVSEMLVRINTDRQAICRVFFCGNDFGRIIKIDGDAGDKHQNGRSALIITAEQGKFLYKPRNMKADTVLYDMVSELFSDVVVLPKALDFGQYGYAEFIADEPAKTAEQAEKFFRRLGGVCALFYTLASTDFHCENTLAKGDFPAIVDLETFLGVQVEADNVTSDKFREYYTHSIHYSGVLPKRVEERELSPLLCKDEHSILPEINGKRVDVRDYLSDFDGGFREIFRRCAAEKQLSCDISSVFPSVDFAVCCETQTITQGCFRGCIR